MPLTKWSFFLLMTKALMAASVSAQEYLSESAGLRAEAIRAGNGNVPMTLILEVQEFGPAWSSGLKPTDVIRSPPERLLEEFDSAAQSYRTANYLGAPFYNNGVQVFIYPGEALPDLIGFPLQSVGISMYPFEGGRWFDDPVTAIERALADPDLEAKEKWQDQFLARARREILAMTCEGASLGEAEALRFLPLLYQNWVYETAAGRPASSTLRRDWIEKQEACETNEIQVLLDKRVDDFDASRGLPASELIEISELGVRLRETTIQFFRSPPTNVLQIHSVQEFGPFWHSSTVKPGDFMLLGEDQIRNQVATLLYRSDEAEWQPNIYAFDARHKVNSTRAGSIRISPFPADGPWFTEPLTQVYRALQDPNQEVHKTIYEATWFTERIQLRQMGCDATSEYVASVDAKLDRLALKAGVFEQHSGFVHEAAQLGCAESQGGKVPREFMALLVGLSESCGPIENFEERFSGFFWSLSLANYQFTAATTVRLALERSDGSARACMMDRVRSRFLDDSPMSARDAELEEIALRLPMIPDLPAPAAP